METIESLEEQVTLTSDLYITSTTLPEHTDLTFDPLTHDSTESTETQTISTSDSVTTDMMTTTDAIVTTACDYEYK